MRKSSFTTRNQIRAERLRLEQMFNFKVNEYGCWIWQGGLSQDGYGKLKRFGKTLRAHHVFWEAYYGPIPDGLWVLHNCPGGDNPLCVNPYHLWVGTQLQNEQDKDRKGRRKVGSRSSAAKFTEEQVKWICESGLSTKQLMGIFDCSRPAIQRIRNGRGWKHVTADRKQSPQGSNRHFGSDNPATKLTTDQVLEIYHSTESSTIMATRFPVTAATICAIRRGKTWSHLTGHREAAGARTDTSWP